MAEAVYIGIDLGGTRIRASRYSHELALLDRTETLTRDEEGPDAVIGRMVEQARVVWPGNGAHVAAIGVSAPGPIDPVNGVITTPPNLQGWHNVPLRDILQGHLGVQVHLGNDANLAALAEFEQGAGRGFRHLVYFTISTGIGSGVVIDGVLLTGAHGLAAECGHLIMVAENGEPTTLEKEAAGPALARQAVQALERGEASSMRDAVQGDLSQIDARIVGKAAKAGDALALRIVNRAARMIGYGVVSVLHAYNPEIVVIGGGVAEGLGAMLFDTIRSTVPKYVIDEAFWKGVVLAPAKLGEDVSLIGAAALARRGGK